MIIDFDLGELEAADLARTITDADALRHFAIRNDEAALGQVTASIMDSIIAEQKARAGGRGNGTVRLSVESFDDDDPDEAMEYRRKAVGYLGLPRDDVDERPNVRHLFASVMADLSDPSPTARAVELVRIKRMTD